MGGNLLQATRPARLAFTWAFGLFILAGGIYTSWRDPGRVGMDTHAYWDAYHHHPVYGLPPGRYDAYLYPPPLAQAMRPLGWLPWPLVHGLWLAASLAAVWWLLRPLRWWWAVPLAMTAAEEVTLGNVHLAFAIVAVLAVRYPAGWLVPAVTKMTPAVGALWYVGAREWRRFAVALLFTAAVVAVSAALDPALWVAWWRYSIGIAGQGGWLYAARIAAAGVLAWWGGRTRRPWTIAVAVVLATPLLGFSNKLTPLLALPRLLVRQPQPVPQVDVAPVRVPVTV